jgi:nucleoside-diphosphate-sugar epimerase
MSRRVLITGATGALGRVLTSRLSEKASGFIVFTPGRRNADDALDLLDRDQIRRAIERARPDLILHLAATFSTDFDEAYAVNVAAARHLLEEVEACGRRVRVVLVGSAAEYGAVTPEDNPITEDHVLRPVSVYGITKAWQTELAYLHASRASDVVVARIFNLVGPHISERLFIGRLHKQINEIRHGNRMQIEVGPLSAIRDYLSIDDAVSRLLTVAEFGEAGRVYHVASGRPITMRELLVRELAAHGLDESIVVEGAALSNRSGHDVPAIYADITRTTALLGKRKSHAKC